MPMISRLPNCFQDSFERAIDQMFDEAWRAVHGSFPARTPDYTAYEDAKGVTLSIAVPGMEAKHFDVRVEGQVLHVKGNYPWTDRKGTLWHLGGLHEGPFACAFRLPDSVDPSKAGASYARGILTITVPRRKESKPRRISITVPMIEGRMEAVRSSWAGWKERGVALLNKLRGGRHRHSP